MVASLTGSGAGLSVAFCGKKWKQIGLLPPTSCKFDFS
jgi:hypothetical protein